MFMPTDLDCSQLWSEKNSLWQWIAVMQRGIAGQSAEKKRALSGTFTLAPSPPMLRKHWRKGCWMYIRSSELWGVCNGDSWTWQDCCNHDVTVPVVAFTRPKQDKVKPTNSKSRQSPDLYWGAVGDRESLGERQSLFFVWLDAFIFALFQQILCTYLCACTYTNGAYIHACMWMCSGM